MYLPDIVQSDLTLRNFMPDEVSREYLDWLVNPRVNRFLEVRHERVTLESQKKFIEEINASGNSSIFGIYLNHKTMVGTIKVGPINVIHQTAPIGILIGEEQHYGKGIATASIGALCDTLFKSSKLRKVNAGVVSENLGSLRAFEKNGFILEGVLKQQFLDRDGVFIDVVLLGKILDNAP